MNFFDRNLVKMLRKAAAKKAPHTYDPQTKALMEANGQDCDWTDKSTWVRWWIIWSRDCIERAQAFIEVL